MAISSYDQFFIFFLLFVSAVTTAIAKSDDCVYTLYVKTGSILKGGTDSKISVTLYDKKESRIQINNIKKWGGLMGTHFNYFERSNLDIFSGRGNCLENPICAMNLTSDGSGHHHGWYSKYVHVTSTGPHKGCEQQLFTVEQWLSKDTPPYELSTLRNSCESDDRVRVNEGKDVISSAM
ncbi:PLAT domain-containing protein 3-like [Impatiens glandulifera]|uniref:PLAT domain-containing protein 3-like n=1 Tax=Impatiens glandulifera TaxID=253017 RepID=UPI001FB098F2|nr:PLAT domain-containing protein 3-like [Impatiens glandulifera]